MHKGILRNWKQNGLVLSLIGLIIKELENQCVHTLHTINIHLWIIIIIICSMLTLEYSCNKYCNLIGHIEVSNQLRDLQVL